MGFLTGSEIDVLLTTPDQHTWSGRRDHALLLVAIQTGLRLSELTGLRRKSIVLGTGAHVRVMGKGRKERATPLAKETVAVLRAWLKEIADGDATLLFPSARGNQLSADGVEYILAKHVAKASETCPSLQTKRVTPHVLRHTTAMELLQAGMERSVIALWLGHESIETTQVYLDANLEMKEKILAKMTPHRGKPGRYRPDDPLTGISQRTLKAWRSRDAGKWTAIPNIVVSRRGARVRDAVRLRAARARTRARTADARHRLFRHSRRRHRLATPR